MREEGVETLWASLTARRDALAGSGELEQRRRRNLSDEVLSAAAARVQTRIEEAIAVDPALSELLLDVQRRIVDPLTAVDTIVRAVLGEDVP